jgi:glutathionyl-hydroquinone reductase
MTPQDEQCNKTPDYCGEDRMSKEPQTTSQEELERVANQFFDAFDKLMEKQDLYPDDLAEKRDTLIAAVMTRG